MESHLPKAIRENIPEEWKKRIASEYLDVNLLFGRDVGAALVEDKLERWRLTVKNNTSSIEVVILFTQYGKIIEDIKIDVTGLSDQSLRKTVIVELRRCHDMYSYVDILISKML